MGRTLFLVPCGRLNCGGEYCHQCRQYWLDDSQEQSASASRDHIPIARVDNRDERDYAS